MRRRRDSLVEVNGAQLDVRRLGPVQESNGYGRPVVMVHGLVIGSQAMWYAAGGAALAARGEVIVYDARGHGRSQRTTDGYSVDALTDDLEVIVDSTVSGALDLVGHSYGALVAANYCRRHPGRVTRVSLIEMPLDPGGLLRDELASRASKEGVRAAKAKIGKELGGKPLALRRVIWSAYEFWTETNVAAELEQQSPVTAEWLTGVQARTQLVYGCGSPCLADGRAVHEAITGSQFELIDGGHFLPLECPAKLAALLVSFHATPARGRP